MSDRLLVVSDQFRTLKDLIRPGKARSVNTLEEERSGATVTGVMAWSLLESRLGRLARSLFCLANNDPSNKPLIQSSSNLISFLGRLHPLIVHLPIGGLVLLGVMEIAERVGWSKNAAQNRRLILGFVCGCTIAAAVCGWSLAKTGNYVEAGLLTWHRWLGLGFVAASLITLAMCLGRWERLYSISLSATLLLMLMVGHLGGSITHGPDFLTRHLPSFTAPGRAMAAQPQSGALPQALMAQSFYSGVVHPFLQEHCVSCHNAQKHKADLRLDSFEELLKGGLDGKVIKAGHAEESALIKCMLSASDADGHMPPESQQQPTAEEIALIEWWVNAGASPSMALKDLKPNARINQLLEVTSQRRDLKSATVLSGPEADQSRH